MGHTPGMGAGTTPVSRGIPMQLPGSAKMSGFSAAEAEFLLNAVLAFFGGKLGNFDSIDDHGIRVVGFGG